MNPLLVSVWNTDWTQTGLQNFETMQEQFGVEAICLHINNNTNRKMSRAAFEHDGFPAHLFDKYIYTYPIWMAIELNIPLIFYGENTSLEYGGPLKTDTPSAIDQINNDAVREYPWSLWEAAGVKRNDIPFAKYPSSDLIQDSRVDPRYMSYYFNWSGYEHMKLAKEYGWKSLNDTGEWDRKGWIDDYTQIDDFAYLVDPYLKYPKYAHRQVTDTCSKLIRENKMTREEGIKLIRDYDSILDPTSLDHYLKFSGYKESQFWEIMEKFWNKELFIKKKQGPVEDWNKINETYQIKNPIWKLE